MNAQHDVHEYAEHKHWSAMTTAEKIDCLTELRVLIQGIDPERLDMSGYITVNGGVNNLDVNKELTDQQYYSCGTAFCMLGWVAPIERFAVAFNVKPKLFTDHYVTPLYDPVGQLCISLDIQADWSLLCWTAFDELRDLFSCSTDSKPHTPEQKEEVLLRIDTTITNLEGELNV